MVDFGEEAPLELSPNNGEGESSMSVLIQKSITNILHPLAERVLELEERSAAQQKHLATLDDKADKAFARLDGHDHKLSAVAADIARINEELRLLNEGLTEHGEKHAALENDHDVTRNLANRTENNHKNTAAALGDLHRSHEGLDAQVRQLQLALSETNIAHLNINDRVTELRNRYEGLNDRHLDLVKSVQETKQGDENTRQALKRFTATFDKQRKDDQRSFSQLDDRAKNLEAGVLETQHQMEVCSKTTKAVKTELNQLKAALDALVGVHQGMQQSESANMRGASDWQGRIGKMEESITKAMKIASSEKTQTLNIVQSLSDQVAKNATDLAKNLSDVENLDKCMKIHDHRLSKAEHLGAETAAKQERMKDQADKTESELRNNISAVQRDAVNKIDAQVHELAKTNAALQQTNQRLDAHGAGLQSLNSELGATNGTVSKLGQSLDLAHEYFQGMSKGFADTHKRVQAGQDGMLPPKHGTTRRLPVISTPRTGGGMPDIL